MDGEAKEVVRLYSAFIHQQINTANQIYVKPRAPVETVAVAPTRQSDRVTSSKFRAEVYALIQIHRIGVRVVLKSLTLPFSMLMDKDSKQSTAGLPYRFAYMRAALSN